MEDDRLPLPTTIERRQIFGYSRRFEIAKRPESGLLPSFACRFKIRHSGHYYS